MGSVGRAILAVVAAAAIVGLIAFARGEREIDEAGQPSTSAMVRWSADAIPIARGNRK